MNFKYSIKTLGILVVILASSCGNSSSEAENGVVVEEPANNTIEITKAQFEYGNMVIGKLENEGISRNNRNYGNH